MSADLLAAFGTSAEETKTQPKPTHETRKAELIPATIENTWQPRPHPFITSADTPTNAVPAGRPAYDTNDDILFDAEDYQQRDDNDEFGAFEQAEPENVSHEANGILKAQRNEDVLLDLAETEPSTTRTQADRPATPPGLKFPEQQYSRPMLQKSSDPALKSESLTTEDDEWGEFAEMSGPTQASSTVGPSARKSLSEVNARSQRSVSMNAPIVNQHISAEESQNDEFDAWDDFPDSSHVSSNPSSNTHIVSESASNQERPTNVPPPAVVLSLLCKVVSELATRARKQEDTSGNGHRVCQIYIVIARVLSGRVLRWKRDTILAQSMRIGAAGRSGGMKLVAIDKGETRKEEQEAEDLIALWTRLSSTLNQAMIRAKAQKPAMTLSTKLSAKTATGIDVISASHVCPICGLKRNERINGIDTNASDTFGEYWVEHWGHKDCSDFWYSYSHMLDQR